MKCEKCNKEHDGSYGSGRFCSKSCANARVYSPELRQKLSDIGKGHPWSRQAHINSGISHRSKWIENLLNKNFDELNLNEKRTYLLIEQNGECKYCNNSEWLGKPIFLELHHKDGNRQNNTYDNLEILCLNCHAQTDGYRFTGKTLSEEHLRKLNTAG